MQKSAITSFHFFSTLLWLSTSEFKKEKTPLDTIKKLKILNCMGSEFDLVLVFFHEHIASALHIPSKLIMQSSFAEKAKENYLKFMLQNQW